VYSWTERYETNVHNINTTGTVRIT